MYYNVITYQVMMGYQNEFPGFLSDFCDGSEFESSILFGADQPALQLL